MTVWLYCNCGDHAKISSSPAQLAKIEISFWQVHQGNGCGKITREDWYRLPVSKKATI